MLRSRSFIAAAMRALGSMSGPMLAAAKSAPVVQVPATKPGKRGLFNDMVLPTTQSRYGRKGAGLSMAQQQRAATKKRNVARNRKHHRG